MEKDIQELFDLLLDNKDLPKRDLILLLENRLSIFLPYNHSESDVHRAFNIKFNDKKFSGIDEKEKLSNQGEILEKTFTKRELSFLLVSLYTQIQKIQKI